MLTKKQIKCLARAVCSLLATFSLLAFASTADAVAELSKADSKCLMCHKSKGLKKTLDNGERMSLHVASDDFAGSVHGGIGCVGCHANVDIKTHRQKSSIESARAYSVEQTQVCRKCHASRFEQYEGSIHATLVSDGNADSPVCTDCHNPHAVQTQAIYATMSGQPCKNCHLEIFQAYEQSVHGLARAEEGGHFEAPICASCHTAHDITAAAANDMIREACIGCHDGAPLAHKQWLPNAAMHLESISCPACHSPQAERRVDLRLYEDDAQVTVTTSPGQPNFEERIRSFDMENDGLDPFELWSLLRTAKRDGESTDITLHGRVEVGTGVDAHRLAAKTSAVRDCDSCHEHGNEVFENVTVSIAQPDGRRLRVEANKEILNHAVSVDSLRNFYAPGSTRVRLLDNLLLLTLAGGLAVPVAHMSLRSFLKKRRNKEGRK